MQNDIDIARQARLKPVREIAAGLGLSDDDIDLYGRYAAKVKLSVLHRAANPRWGRLILVSAITPTPAGEGKTTVAIGLAQALARLGKRSSVAIREPSVGPVMGMKGGATGGGRSQVLPMEDINLHFTGDIPAVEAAHNLLAAMIDNHIFQGNELGIDPRTVLWRRVMDINDRALRNCVIGLGGRLSGVPREAGFDITAASEVMAILCLAEGRLDLKHKLDRILVGFRTDGAPVTAQALKTSGAMGALLRHAIKPNLVQTTEGVPAFIHGGPFANVAQGTNSVLATRLALLLTDYAVTEAGFGFELGAEKYFDIVARYGKLDPAVVVLVATVRALKMHGGVPLAEITKPDPPAVVRGLPNLRKHVEDIRHFGMPLVVCLNRFTTDTDEEIAAVRSHCCDRRETFVTSDIREQGGAGGLELARAVLEIADTRPGHFTPLYDWNDPVEEKIRTVAHEMYGAQAIDYLPRAKADLERIYKLGYDKLPVCIAKTQKSLSDNPDLLGRPKDFVATVREVVIAAGAGFLIPITGDIVRMPGLPRHPAAERIDIDETGTISGLF